MVDPKKEEAKARLGDRVVSVMRSLQRLTYIRTRDPEAVVRDIREVLSRVEAEFGVEVQVVQPGDLDSDERMQRFEELAQAAVKDIRAIKLVYLVGTAPCTQVVPERIRYLIYPIDLVEGPCAPREVPTGRVEVEEEVLKTELAFNSFCLGLRLPEEGVLDLLARCRGLCLYEAQSVLAMSVVETKARRQLEGKLTLETLADRGIVDAYRNRWSCVE